MGSQKLIKCYHISRIKNRESILKSGLIPRDNNLMGYTERLFFSINKRMLGFDYVDYENVDVWSFFIPKDKIKTDKNAWNKCFCYASEKIPAEKIKLEKTVF